jgi:hypothetical protein
MTAIRIRRASSHLSDRCNRQFEFTVASPLGHKRAKGLIHDIPTFRQLIDPIIAEAVAIIRQRLASFQVAYSLQSRCSGMARPKDL